MNKPVIPIQELIDSFKNEGNVTAHKFAKNTISYLTDSNHLVMLDSGCVSFYRTSDNKLMFLLQAPFPIGITKILDLKSDYYIKCDSEVILYFISIDIARGIVEKNNLWKNVLNVVCYMIQLNETTSSMSYNAYDMVKTSLFEISKLPDNQKINTSVFDYIMQRHNISRSSIAKIIKSLSDGGYIKYRRGILIELGKLPSKY